MSRKIKFRVWDEKVKIYYYNVAALPGGIAGLQRLWITLGTDQENEWLPYPDLILEQYTGLTDKNGVEIYEGDIVKIQLNKIAYENLIVEFDNGEWVLKRFPIDIGFWNCLYQEKGKIQIIGNIHESPELLNQSKSTSLEGEK